MPAQPWHAAVVTVSDRCSAGLREDRSGPLAVGLVEAAGFVATRRVVPDGADSVAAAVRAVLDAGARLVVTTGGTGVGPRDRTPEGTRGVLDRELPGLAERIRAASDHPHAALSRGLVGVVDRPGALVVNLPGSTGGVREGLSVVLPIAHHVIDQLQGGDH